MTAKNNCLECGQETANPRFCSRSCAAKFNNRKNPKRSPEGTCGACGAPISSSRSYCSDCWKRRQEPDRKQHRQAFVTERTVFNVYPTPLAADAPVGQFLDAFLEVAELQPRYLPPVDWERHRQFVGLLRGFRCSGWSLRHDRRELAADDVSLSRLEFLLHEWVRAVAFDRTAHPLAATFALETATVLAQHARGDIVYGGNGYTDFELKAMTASESRFPRKIADSTLKREITQRTLRELHVVAQLPDEVEVLVHGERVDRGTGRLHFIVHRCHQSTSTLDRHECDLLGGRWEPFDLSDSFEFYGSVVIRPQRPDPADRSFWSNREPFLPHPPRDGDNLACGLLPVRWIIGHSGYFMSTEGSHELRPLPTEWTSLAGEANAASDGQQTGPHETES